MPIDVTSRSAFKRARSKKGQGPSAQDKLAILFNAFVARTWWWPKKRFFYYRDPDTDEINEHRKEDFREFLIGEGFFKKFVDFAVSAEGNGNLSDTARTKVEKKALGNSWIKFCHVVQKTRCVAGVYEIAGYAKGEIRQGDDRILVRKGPKLIPAKKGDCSFIQTFCEQLHGEAAPYIFTGFKLDRISLEEQRHGFGYALLLTGPSDIGKSCFQHSIMTPWYGGRSADAFKFLSGKTGFNKALMGCEHLFLDDHSFSGQNQRVIEEAVKRIVSKSTEEVEAKGVDAITLGPLVRRLSVSINEEPHNLAGMPTIRRDNIHKLMLVICRPAEILAGMSEAEIKAKIEKQFPAFVYWILYEFEPPKELFISDNPAEKRAIKRFGFKNYIDPIFRERLSRESDAENLRDLILETPSDSGKPAALYARLISDPIYGPAIKKIAYNLSFFSTLFQELAEEYPEEFSISGSEHRRIFAFTNSKTP